MKFLSIFLSLLYLLPARATDTGSSVCIRLEGISIGCVPSYDHPCIRNTNPEAMGYKNGACSYLPDSAFANPPPPDLFDKNIQAMAGPIALFCQTWEPGSVCPPGGDVTTCPGSKCVKYANPVCKTKCEWCIKDKKIVPSEQIGCMVCTRPYCGDEPPLSPFCALHPKNADGTDDLTYTLPKRGLPKCPAKVPTDPCPEFFDIPVGSVCETMKDGKCPVLKEPGADCGPRPLLQKATEVPRPKSCPWVHDDRTYTPPQPGPPPVPGINHCEEIKPGNRFPEDCKWGDNCFKKSE